MKKEKKTIENDEKRSALFDVLLEQFEKSDVILNAASIKRIIEGWKIKEFNLDENGRVTNEFAVKELGDIVDKLMRGVDAHFVYAIIGKAKTETEKIKEDTVFIDSLFLDSLCFWIYGYFERKADDSGAAETAFIKLTLAMLENSRGALYSYVGEDFLTVIQKARTLYECYVLFLFINKHRELAKPFLDYVEAVTNVIRDNTDGYETGIPQAPGNGDGPRYGEEGFEPYPWAAGVVPEKANRNLAYFAEDAGITEEMETLYKITSHYIPISAYSAFTDDVGNRKSARRLLPVVAALERKHVSLFAEAVGKVKHQRELIGVLLRALEDALFPDFEV